MTYPQGRRIGGGASMRDLSEGTRTENSGLKKSVCDQHLQILLPQHPGLAALPPAIGYVLIYNCYTCNGIVVVPWVIAVIVAAI